MPAYLPAAIVWGSTRCDEAHTLGSSALPRSRCLLVGRPPFALAGSQDGGQQWRHLCARTPFLRHRQRAEAVVIPGGDVMAAIYGMLVALPMVWGCAGYAMVSHPGTAEPNDSRAAAKLMARTTE